LGLGSSRQATENADRVAGEIQTLCREAGGEVPARSESGPSEIVFLREITGFPLHYYRRLSELRDAYYDIHLDERRKTCHIKYRETLEDLPDLEMLPNETAQNLEQHMEMILWALFLRVIRLDSEGVFVAAIPGPHIGHELVRLGTRFHRLLKRASERGEILAFFRHRLEQWRLHATAAHWAAFYVAVQMTLDNLPSPPQGRPWPTYNCLQRLLEWVEEQLNGAEGGAAWLAALRPVPDNACSSERRLRTMALVAQKCLRQASAEMPLLQLDEARIAELTPPREEPT
jgi:hypothetical protein